jgi:hypothetical protein
MLLVEPPSEDRLMRAFHLRLAGYDVEVAADLEQAEQELAARPADVVLVAPPLTLEAVRDRLRGVLGGRARVVVLGDPSIG